VTKEEARQARKIINALIETIGAVELEGEWFLPDLRAYQAKLRETIYQGEAKLNMQRMFPSPRRVAGAEWLRTARFINEGGCR
jgi:hypothetical protein